MIVYGLAMIAAALSTLQQAFFAPNLGAVKKPMQTYVTLDGECAGPKVCPLSQVAAGMVVCIKKLEASPETTDRLRELGFCEQQRIKLLRRHNGFICQVCDARLALSDQLAEAIIVEHVHA
jgi:Fe2+ transport system protein FeoA